MTDAADLTPEDREIREFLSRVDSVCSLVAYRYPSSLPADIVQELKEVSGIARKKGRGSQ